MALSLSKIHADAWSKLNFGKATHPEQIFPRFEKTDFEKLKSDYNATYGYTIRIPTFDDIIHLVPNSMKTPAQIKLEKKANLVKALESPQTDWFNSYSSVMTWVDNIQDTASVVYPAMHVAYAAAPKLMSKLLPGIGWILAAYDILNIVNSMGRAVLSPMAAKRDLCDTFRRNPFSKKSNLSRVDKIKSWKPNVADLLQFLQVTDQLLGIGLSLGAIMGAATAIPFGAYRYATGKPVRITFDPPEFTELELMGSRGMTAAAAISSQRDVFTETVHFWTYVTATLSSVVYGTTYRDNALSDMIEDPMSVMMPAPEPTDPLTIEVIKEMGLNVEDGVRWPYNREKFISMGDLFDAQLPACQDSFHDYCLSHKHDAYGYVAAAGMDFMIPHNLLAIEPQAEWEQDDTDEMKIMYRMIKAPILPKDPYTLEQSAAFWKWTEDFKTVHGNMPGVMAIQEQLDLVGIRYSTSYPTKQEPDPRNFLPPNYKSEFDW